LTAARLSLDDLVETTLKTALASLTKGGAFIVYRADQGKALIDLHKSCPACGHPWPLHFKLVDEEGKKLFEPKPDKCTCAECSCMAQAVMGWGDHHEAGPQE
jgi:hypothetical protein